MSVFDKNNPPSEPDSDLDSDLDSVATFTIEGSLSCQIAPGDWVDVDQAYVSPDPTWGMSFQVVDVDPDSNQVQIFIYDPGSQEYTITNLSCTIVTNNFRRVSTTTA